MEDEYMYEDSKGNKHALKDMNNSYLLNALLKKTVTRTIETNNEERDKESADIIEALKAEVLKRMPIT